MTGQYDEAARDLVARAHKSDPELVDFDVTTGLRDVRRRAQRALAGREVQDPLTGLPNARALHEGLHQALTAASSHPLAIALVNLDNFKRLCDRCGHTEGDDVLRVVASTLRSALRHDHLVARFGGQEFAVLMPGAPVAEAEAALRRGVNAIAELPYIRSHGVTLSIGVIAARTGEGADQVLARADAALYQAKRQGGNRIATSPSLETDVNLPATDASGRHH